MGNNPKTVIYVYGYGTPVICDAKRHLAIRIAVILSGVSIGFIIASLLSISLPVYLRLILMGVVWIIFVLACIRDLRRPIKISLEYTASESIRSSLQITGTNIVVHLADDSHAYFVPLFNRRYQRRMREDEMEILSGKISKTFKDYVKSICINEGIALFRPHVVVVEHPVQSE